MSPFGKLGTRITEVVKGDTLFWVILISIGVVAGVIVVAISAFAQASAIGGVSQLEQGRETGLRKAISLGDKAFWRFLILTLAYILLTAALALPGVVFWSGFGKENKGVFFPCILGVLLGLFLVLISVLLSMVFEFSCRYIVLRSMGILNAVRAAVSLIREFSRETVLAWLTTFFISIASALAMAIMFAALTSPLNALYTFIYDHHNGLLIALGMLVSVIVWFIAVAVSGVFAVSAGAVWTVSFMEFDSVHH